MKYRHLYLSLAVLALAACEKAAPPVATSSAPAPIVATTPASAAATPAMPTVTFAPNADGFIQNWLILDPIALEGVGDHSEDVEKPMFAKEYFKDELTVIPHDKDKVTVNGKSLPWRKVKTTEDAVDLAQFSADNNTDPTSCLYFGFTYIIAAEDRPNVKLAIGSDDSSLWWLNGQEVIRAYSARAVNADDDTSKAITLKKGLNVLRFAVIQGGGPTGACARFYDAKDKPLTGIKVSADVPQ